MKTFPIRVLLSLLLLLLGSGQILAQSADKRVTADSANVIETIQAFQEALAARDSAAVNALLLPDAVILESGGFETKDEYFDHHFGADAAFLENMDRETLRRQVRIENGTAWVSTSSRMNGTYNGESLERASAELMVLRRTAEGWRIAAIHWSSRSLEE